ncbi:MAG: HD-GYP domain-containing protein [Actinomycetota bacterium]|nr:MAG: metal dependent [Actinomycetota bacterium]MDO8950296.1 HD-GYP domain-containing protein [Actinomycetota bacterium]MDP3629777.1 HD-GYP domain-containing protein [Actinomycetota bacterium]
MTDETRSNEERLETNEEIASLAQPASRTPFATAKRLERARDLARTFAVAQTNASLYPASHPLVMQSNADFVAAVSAVMALGFEDVTINVYKGTLFIEDHVLPEESVTYRKLIVDLLAHEVSAVTLDYAFSENDAVALVGLMNESSISEIGKSREYLESKGATAVKLAETTDLDSAVKEAEERQNKLEARQDYDKGVTIMRDVETQVKLGKVFEVGPLQNLVGNLLDNLFKDPAAVLGLTAIRSHDDYTLNHSINVCILSLSLGATLGLDAESLKSLGLSALLYDLGKVRIPEGILNKEGPLSADEWQIVKSHASEGADLLKRIQLVDQMPMVVAYEHHQRHDMQGYPEVSAPSEQHLFSKIVALCDAYDAMTTRRPFRREIRPDKALAVLMQGRNKAYDPSITKALVAMLGIYPMGAVVTMNDGTTGVVFRVNRDDLLRPRIRRLIDQAGRWLEQPETVDLRLISEESGTFSLSITDCIPAAEAGIEDVWQYL